MACEWQTQRLTEGLYKIRDLICAHNCSRQSTATVVVADTMRCLLHSLQVLGCIQPHPAGGIIPLTVAGQLDGRTNLCTVSWLPLGLPSRDAGCFIACNLLLKVQESLFESALNVGDGRTAEQRDQIARKCIFERFFSLLCCWERNSETVWLGEACKI